MKVKILSESNNWIAIKDAAMTTVGKESGTWPSSKWKRTILLAEHSPIRLLVINWKWTDLLSWVSVHFVRHKFGIEHFVKSQRTDRTGVDRNTLTQSELISHECSANAQALIFISRKRLCNMAAKETREAWTALKDAVKAFEPELASVMVRECVYRNGLCHEFYSCGYNKTEAFKIEMDQYIKGE